VRFNPVFAKRAGLCGVAAMPVEPGETQPLAGFGQPAHPDKGGTVPIAPGQTIHPGKVNTLDVAVSRVPIRPRPETEELANNSILIHPTERRQPDYRRIVCQVVSHLQPRTHKQTSPSPAMTCQNQHQPAAPFHGASQAAGVDPAPCLHELG
jgi:hypothetical protein